MSVPLKSMRSFKCSNVSHFFSFLTFSALWFWWVFRIVLDCTQTAPLYPSEQKALIAAIYMAASVSCWQDTAPRRGIKGQEWTLSPPFCTSPNKHKINLSGGRGWRLFSPMHTWCYFHLQTSGGAFFFFFYLNAHRLSSGEEQQQMQRMSNHQHNWVRFKKKKKKMENMLPFFIQVVVRIKAICESKKENKKPKKKPSSA